MRGLCAASARGALRRFGAGKFAPLRRGNIYAASAREYLRRGSAGGECACGARRFVLARLYAGMRFGRRRFVLARLYAGMRLGRRRFVLARLYAGMRLGRRRAMLGKNMPLPGAGRLTYFLAALSALQLWDILCPCIAREHPLGRGGKRKSEQKSTFPLSQTGFPSRSLSPQPSPPCRFFLLPRGTSPAADSARSFGWGTLCRYAA